MNNGHDQPRIGVYICHCGHNIAGTIDVAAVAKYVEGLPGVVVSRDYKYMCSEPGQELIQWDIKGHKLNRIVVASCSPLLHEHTFRNATEKGGINPFFFQMVNIREHNSWVHTDRAAATQKAKAQIHGAVRRVAGHRALETKKVAIHPDVLVVGGGIAGIHAAVTMANAGKKVYLVEREPSIGGHMAKFDKTFPTLDCAACILTPKMSSVGNHPNITLWTYSEVAKVDGFVGNYKVTVKRKPRYIIEDLCIGCQECITNCVYKEAKFPDEFNEGLGKRKPVYIPFAQATPQVVLIDPELCLNFKRGVLTDKCKKTCVEACADRKAIDFQQQEEIKEIQVGTVIVATGFKTFDAKRVPYYGYGKYQNVYTSLEVERLVNASGPTGGEVILRDGKKPQTVAIVHCVGSRDVNYHEYCSRVCCMYALKYGHLIHDKIGPEAVIHDFYIDLRCFGKGYEEFYRRCQEEGVHFIRGKPAQIECREGKLVLVGEDTLLGRLYRIPVDMVVLCAAMQARKDAEEVGRIFGVSRSRDGFFLEEHPKLAPLSTATDGVFLAGTCQAPRDVPDAVAQASGAAAKVLSLIVRGRVEIEPTISWIDPDICAGCQVCLGLCAYSAISFDERRKVSVVNEALCKGCGSCSGFCPSGAARSRHFDNRQIFSEIDGLFDAIHAVGR
ncbi:MAG: CoB--CoM heterodisulfide reductase iron-sulfur subunit A family protein [Verrucomicrobia bacterium]|nr:CoB--CoM heterodisulfide reductase iron-sulfur subunit A family protein [Verrucomicrobiota bacterium]